MPAKYVFHAVGPRYRDGKHGEAELLKSCYTTCLHLAEEHQVASIGFPSISTGIYGYPIEGAADIALRTILDWLRGPASSLRVVKLIQFSDRDHGVYRKVAENLRQSAAFGRHA